MAETTFDVEGLVTSFLDAEFPDVYVAGELPEDVGQSFIKVRQDDIRKKPTADDLDFFHTYFIQLDCYSNVNGPEGQESAWLLVQTVRTSIAKRLLEADHSDFGNIVLSDVRFGGSPRVADTDFKPPRQRYVLDVMIDGRLLS